MSEQKYKILGEYKLAVEAHMARTFLEQHGIEALVHDEYANRIAFYNTGAFGGVKLRVKSEDFEKAKELLTKVNERNLQVVGEEYQPPKGLTRMDVLRSALFILIFVLIVILILYTQVRV